MNNPTFLIIKPSSLGDIVHGLLVAQMIKIGAPESRIDWICRDIFAPVVQACLFVDRVLLFERNGGPVAFLRLIRKLRRRHYTHVLDMQGLARSGLLTALARATTTIGRMDAREGAGWVYSQRAPLPRTGKQSHAVAILSEFLPLLGLPRDVNPHLQLRISGPNPLEPFEMPAPPVLIFPESSRAEKNWPFFPELTAELRGSIPRAPIVWAGAKPMPYPAEQLSPGFVNLTGKTNLQDLLQLLSQARLVIGNDSGPLHLAAALGTPTLALFGPTDPARYRPFPGNDRQNRIQRAPQGDFRLLRPEKILESIRDMLTQP